LLGFNLHASQPTYCVREIHGVYVAQIVFAQDSFFNFGACFEQMAAINSRQEAAVDWRGQQFSVFLNKYAADCALGELAALVEEEKIVEALALRLLKSPRVQLAPRSFVEEHGVGEIGAFV
jgi:hypothetical protein